MPKKLGNILRRLRPRFTLRALLLVVTLLCLLLGREVEVSQRDSRALRELARRRDFDYATLRFGHSWLTVYDGPLPALETVNEVSFRFIPEDVPRELAELGRLECAYFYVELQDETALPRASRLLKSMPGVPITFYFWKFSPEASDYQFAARF